jgi:Tol biopolymer transport system component
MNDRNQTIYPPESKSGLLEAQQPPAQPSEPGSGPPSVIYIPGYVLLLCVLLLISCGSFPFLASEQSDDSAVESSAENETLLDSTTTSPSGSENANGENSSTEGSAGDSISAEALVTQEPEIGEITFALGATDEYEPIAPNLLFTKGITEIHAIFEYSGMSADYTWERVWYLNDKEVARSSTPWTGLERGVFDYFIDNGGNPLPAGDWILELYVEGKLQSLGVFIIEETEAESVGGESVYQLVFSKCDGDHHNVYVADTNGRNEQLVVTRGAGPGWSPDGGLIFFFGESGVDRQVRDGLEYVFEGISSGLVAVRASPLPTRVNQLSLFQNLEWKQGDARWAKVSPDGSMVAYDANPGGDYRVYFLGTAANQQFRYEIPGEQADWSPDSQKIVYRSGRNGQVGIWISDRDDSNPRRITDNGTDSFPAWSPDGRTIAFSRDEGGNVDVYTVNVDGSNLRRLTNASGHDTLATYGPNGDIIFRSTRTGSWGIWKMAGDGSGQTEIIPNACVGNDWAYSMMDVLP